MVKRVLLGTLALLCALALVTPANAATVNGVDYVFLARIGALIESGSTVIQGNVGVSDPLGQLNIGAHVTINGKAIAHKLILGSFAKITTCEFDITAGVAPNPPVCGTAITPASLPIFAGWAPNSGPLGSVPINNCVNAGANVTVPANTAQALAPGCYKDVRVNGGGTLNLSAGSYVFKTLRMIAGSTLNGNGATVNVQSLTISEGDVTWNNATIETPGSAAFSVTEFISIGPNNRFNNVVLYAPSAAIHVRGGSQGTNFEAVANFLTVEPVQFNNETPPECGCFDTVTDGNNSVTISGGENLTKVQKFFLSTSCDVTTCVAPGCNEIPAGNVNVVDNANATINTTGVPNGTYKVVGQWSSGTYCNNTTVTVP